LIYWAWFGLGVSGRRLSGLGVCGMIVRVVLGRRLEVDQLFAERAGSGLFSTAGAPRFRLPRLVAFCVDVLLGRWGESTFGDHPEDLRDLAL